MGTIQTNTTKHTVCIRATHVNFKPTETFIQLFVWLTLAYYLQPVVSVPKLKPSLKISLPIEVICVHQDKGSLADINFLKLEKNAIKKKIQFQEVGDTIHFQWYHESTNVARHTRHASDQRSRPWCFTPC